MNVFRLIKRLLPYLRPIWPQVAISLVCLMLSPVASTLLLSLVEKLIDNVFVAGHISELTLFLAGYVGLVGLKFLVDRVQEGSDLLGSRRVTTALKADFYEHVLTVSPGTLPDLSVGQAMSRMSGDAKQANILVFSGAIGVLANLVRVIVYTAFLYCLSGTLTLIALLVVPVLGFTSLRGSSHMQEIYDRLARTAGSTTSLAEERLSARMLIQAFGTARREAVLFREKCAGAIGVEWKGWTYQAGLTGAFEAVSALAAVGLIWIGAHEIHTKAMSVGALVAYLGSLGYVYDPAKSLAKSWSKFQKAASSAQRLVDLLDTPSQVAEPSHPVALGRVAGAIEFRDVHFGYEGDDVLKGVSFQVAAGENVAIVGASGAGKSTILKLLLRLYDASAGAVLLDGIDVKHIAIADLRAAMSVVLQDANIMRGTVAENLRYGNPDAPEARLQSMAWAAQAHDFIEATRHGYAGKTGPRGASFSGGQRQRLALARALVREAPILILDEATASLDGETEQAIQNALREVAGRRTVVTIAHRLASIRQADRVIVLEEGKVVESGSPLRLLNADSRCRRLFSSQLSTMAESA